MIQGIIGIVIVAAILWFAWRAKRKDSAGVKPPNWTNPAVPPADRADPPGKAKL